MTRIGQYGAAAAVVLLAASLVGCDSDDPEPQISPSTTVSSSASPSPSISPTPEAETPEAFIRRWAELETEMQNTGKTTQYRTITSKCEPCTRTADLVDKFYAAGGFIRTDGRSVEALSLVGEDDGMTTLRVRMRSAPTEYKESSEGPLKNFPGGLSTYRVTLKSFAGGWELLGYVELAS